MYEDSGDAEACDLAVVLSSYSGVATVIVLSAVLDLLTKLNGIMQRKATDFSRLPIILESILAELKHLNGDGAEWCSQVESTLVMLTREHDIPLRGSSTQSGRVGAITKSEYQKAVAVPYIAGPSYLPSVRLYKERQGRVYRCSQRRCEDDSARRPKEDVMATHVQHKDQKMMTQKNEHINSST